MFLKTLHLTNAYHPTSGGIRTMYRALLHEANRERRLMRLIVPAERDGEERVGLFGLIYYVRTPRAPFADRRYRVLLPHRFAWYGVGRLWTILRREAPDVLEVCDKYSLCYLSGLLRRFAGRDRPTLVGLSCERLDDNLAAYVHGGDVAARAAKAYLGRVYLGMFDAHIANSHYTAQELREAMLPKHRRPVHVCPMGVELPPELTPAERSAARHALRATCGEPDAPVVMYAGRLSPEKHVALLPGVLSALIGRGSAVRIVIVGDGPLRSALQSSMASIAPGRAHFLGHISDRGALARLVAASDVFLHPNPKEPFGIGPLEAMAAGTPVIVANGGGVLSYATKDNAWITAPTPGSFADAIESALSNEPERQRRAAQALRTARQFSWPEAAARMFRTYEWVHAARAGRPAPGAGHPAPPAHASGGTGWRPAPVTREAEACRPLVR